MLLLRFLLNFVQAIHDFCEMFPHVAFRIDPCHGIASLLLSLFEIKGKIPFG
jgi:hypothetical protein